MKSFIDEFIRAKPEENESSSIKNLTVDNDQKEEIKVN